MNRVIVSGLLSLWGLGVFAQNAMISGSVFDKENQSPLPFVTVQVDNSKGEIIAGTISGDDGIFELANIPSGDWLIKLSYIGYNTVIEHIHVGILNNNYDLGKIRMYGATVAIDDVEVMAKKATVSAGLQKKSFDMDDNIAQSGGSVLKAIQNLPSVTVSSDGVVSLRGSNNVLVLIDGKQSSLTGFGTQTSLDNIPASNVARIEIINNPSAKFDAKGNAGIINIVYKKETKKGFNGEAGLAVGAGEITNNPENIEGIEMQDKYAFTPKVSPSFLVNYRSDKVNYFIQADGMVRTKINCNMFTDRIYSDGRTTNQQFSEMREQAMYNLKFGFDWFLSENNQLTLFGLWEDEYHADHGAVPYIYNDATKNNRLWEWTEDEDTKFMNFTALFSHNFKQAGHALDFAYNYTGGREDEWFPFSDKYFDANGNQVGETNYDNTHLFVWEFVHNITLDYVKPLRSGRIESGIFTDLRSIPIDYTIVAGTPPTTYMDMSLGDWSEYTENVFAAYGNYVFESKKIEAELGLRIEESFINYKLDDENIYYSPKNKADYFNLYPNTRFTYKINTNNKLSLFYNKRIDRPNEFQLRPFPKYDDPEVLRTGNPALAPQYTQSTELAYKYLWKSGSFFVAGYQKWIDNIISRVAISDPAILDVINYVPENFGQGTNSGFEIVIEQELNNWWNFDANFNWYKNTIEAFSGTSYYPASNGIDFSVLKESSNTWNMKVNTDIKLENGFGAQLAFIYYAPDIRPQADISRHYGFNFGISQQIMGGKGEIYLNGNDIFNTDKIEETISADDFTMVRKDYLETQVFMVGMKYKF
ncbi:TonB-dependent receptor family protein [bacterium]|nr:TonB-dependent receptor family protein [bacterium]